MIVSVKAIDKHMFLSYNEIESSTNCMNSSNIDRTLGMAANGVLMMFSTILAHKPTFTFTHYLI